MNNWSNLEILFRCERLSVRMERLAVNFDRVGDLSQDSINGEAVIEIIRESKMFLELIAIDLDVDRAFELAQIQRQLSRWHIHWLETWTNNNHRLEIATLARMWAQQIRAMAVILV